MFHSDDVNMIYTFATFQQLGIDYAAMGVVDPSLNIGVCLPNSCVDKDITILIYKRK